MSDEIRPPEGEPDPETPIKKSEPTLDRRKRKTPAERRAWREREFSEDVVRYLEQLDRQPNPVDPEGFLPPSTFGLTNAELLAEVRRCQATGWAPWEIVTRFVRVSA